MQYSEVSHVYRLRVISELRLFGVRRKKEEWYEERKRKGRKRKGRKRKKEGIVENRGKRGNERGEKGGGRGKRGTGRGRQIG